MKLIFIDIDSFNNFKENDLKEISILNKKNEYLNIHIISSIENNRITFDTLSVISNHANIKFHKIKSNLLDKIEYITNFIRQEEINYIVSKDKDLDLMIESYQKTGIIINRVEYYNDIFAGFYSSDVLFSEIKSLYLEKGIIPEKELNEDEIRPLLSEEDLISESEIEVIPEFEEEPLPEDKLDDILDDDKEELNK